jgi:hypothetical protein
LPDFTKILKYVKDDFSPLTGFSPQEEILVNHRQTLSSDQVGLGQPIHAQQKYGKRSVLIDGKIKAGDNKLRFFVQMTKYRRER